MLEGLFNKAWNQVTLLHAKYELSQRRLLEHISMRPKDILWRSAQAANWATFLVIIICYPIIFYFRGWDFDLMRGMLLHYSIFWLVVLILVGSIQLMWLISYCLTQRFCENLLDFEILDRILGYDQEVEMSDMEDLDSSSDGKKRAKG